MRFGGSSCSRVPLRARACYGFEASRLGAREGVAHPNVVVAMDELKRQGTMSSKTELLRQIRDAVNPNQKLQNYIQIGEALV